MLDTITYTPSFVKEPEKVFKALWEGLAWERRGSTPRREYYCNDVPVPYTYGKGAGIRSYRPSVWTPEIMDIKRDVEASFGCSMEVCFLNGYENSRDHLGWHSDDSPEMDDSRPIAIVTLGAEREINFAPLIDLSDVTRLKLESGSLCVMAPGMQDSHAHKIPKAGFECGPRISLTFRGFVGA